MASPGERDAPLRVRIARGARADVQRITIYLSAQSAVDIRRKHGLTSTRDNRGQSHDKPGTNSDRRARLLVGSRASGTMMTPPHAVSPDAASEPIGSLASPLDAPLAAMGSAFASISPKPAAAAACRVAEAARTAAAVVLGFRQRRATTGKAELNAGSCGNGTTISEQGGSTEATLVSAVAQAGSTGASGSANPARLQIRADGGEGMLRSANRKQKVITLRHALMIFAMLSAKLSWDQIKRERRVKISPLAIRSTW